MIPGEHEEAFLDSGSAGPSPAVSPEDTPTVEFDFIEGTVTPETVVLQGNASPPPAVRSEGEAADAMPQPGVRRLNLLEGDDGSDLVDVDAGVTNYDENAERLAEATELLRDFATSGTHEPSPLDSAVCGWCDESWPCLASRARRFLTRTGQPQ